MDQSAINCRMELSRCSSVNGFPASSITVQEPLIILVLIIPRANLLFLSCGASRIPTVTALAKLDRKSTRLNSSHSQQSRMPSSA